MTKTRTTSFGKAIYPHLTGADYKFKSEGLYHVDLEVSSDDAKSEVTAINDAIKTVVIEQHKKNGNKEVDRAPLPYKTENGKTILKFKMKASGINSKTKQHFTQKPCLYDNELNEFPEGKSIWGDSIIRVSYEPHGYYSPLHGAGCTLRLKSVQVKNLVEGSNGKSAFSKVDGNSSGSNGESVLPEHKAPEKAKAVY